MNDYTTIITNEGFTLSGEQAEALRKIETEHNNFFITGKAGTGKSVLLRAFVERARDSRKRVVVLAPTGLAAENVDGQTIHSFLHISTPIMDVARAENIEIDDETTEVYQNIDILVIDEISMVRSDYMDMLDVMLKRVRESSEPFGGVQIVAFGDLYQLPPVIDYKKPSTASYIKDRYKTVFFFGAPAIRRNPFEIIELQQVRRQNDDSFIEMLNNARVGNEKLKTMQYFNKLYTEDPADNYPNAVIIATTKKYVKKVNDEQLNKLNTEEMTYTARMSQNISNEYFDDSIIEAQLKLKVGAKIMMIRNDRAHRWVNGTVGYVESLSDNEVGVRINDRVYQVGREEWYQYNVTYNKENKTLNQTRVGTITQFPIKVAYAITVHKSQGQTLESVIIDFSDNPPFEAGQTYVALSRCKSYEGMVLKSRVVQKYFKVNDAVKRYMAKK